MDPPFLPWLFQTKQIWNRSRHEFFLTLHKFRVNACRFYLLIIPDCYGLIDDDRYCGSKNCECKNIKRLVIIEIMLKQSSMTGMFGYLPDELHTSGVNALSEIQPIEKSCALIGLCLNQRWASQVIFDLTWLEAYFNKVCLDLNFFKRAVTWLDLKFLLISCDLTWLESKNRWLAHLWSEYTYDISINVRLAAVQWQLMFLKTKTSHADLLQYHQ
jgi:hypothetical protein